MDGRPTVRKKLFWAIFAPSLTVLFLVGLITIGLDLYSLRRTIIREAQIQASLLALALRGPLALQDDRAVGETLSALKSSSDILSGKVYAGHTNVLAEYPAPLERADPQSRSGLVQLSEDIRVGDERIGSLLLNVTLARYYHRVWWYALGAIVSLLFFTFLAAFAASVLGHRFSNPITQLSETARKIAAEKDYTLRAPEFEQEEFNTLSFAFNQMLEQINLQNAALSERNAELARANRELEAFTYTVSHDLRTPLRAISSFSRLLLETESAGISSECRESLERIEKNAIKMAQLIDDLLAFSKVDAQEVSRTTCDLTALATVAWENLSSERTNRDILCRIDPLGQAQADPALLDQVFSNLLSNAIKYSQPKDRAEIHVGLASTADSPRTFFVRDNGVGFDMTYSGKLFQVFQRLHKQKDFEGTGVGLAIVHRIIVKHGGKIWAEAEPGKGAWFYFTLS